MSTSGEPADLARRLEGVRALVLASRGTPDAQVRGAVGALHGAGADLIGLWWLTDQWTLDDEAQRRGLAGWLGLEGDDPDQVRAEVARRLAAALAGRRRTFDPDLLTALVGTGLIEPAGPDPDDGDPPVLGGGARAIVLGGADPGAGGQRFAAELVQALAATAGHPCAIAAQGPTPEPAVAPVGGVLVGGAAAVPESPDAPSRDTPDGERRTTFVGPVRDDAVARGRVATIDHLDVRSGRAALVLAAAELGDGAVGHYGVGRGASAVRPMPVPARRGDRLRHRARAVRRAPAETWLGAAVVLACAGFVFSQLQPSLLLSHTTPAGGDMGAHVWGPAYIRDHLLPHWRLTGWTPDWYAGFPAFQFYMLPPALLIILINVVIPYGIAFKLVTVLGVLTLPVAAYVMGRLFRMPFPGPPLLAAATVPYLFDRTWTIYGGNIASTLAGEYSFSISLSLTLVFFGVLARGLENGKHRGLAAVLLALVVLCHAIPAFFAVVGGTVLVLMRLDRKRIAFAAPVLALGCMLTAFWSVPFVLRRGLLTDMGWEKLVDYKAALLPDSTRWVLILALIGVVLSLAFFIRIGAFFAVLAVLSALGFWLDAAAPFHIWNARLLPFFYLSLYLLAAVGVSEVVRSLSVLIDGRSDRRRRSAEGVGAVLALAAVLIVVALPLHALPGGSLKNGTYSWMGIHTRDDSFVDSWAKWNYSGYEGKDAYPEYRSIISTMAKLGQTDGCGRAHWEYSGDLNRYGTPMALMLLPFWTNGCIGSMEGLYFESSATTPFHFLDASELSVAPSNPVRDLPDRPMPYSPFNLDKGVRHLQLMGVRYYMAFSDQAIQAADKDPELTLVAASAPWKVYEVADSAPVAALKYQPAVLRGMSNTNPAWDKDAVAWYTDPTDLDVPLAPSGPSAWQRVDRGQVPDRRALPTTKVSNIQEGDLSIGFDVDRVGEPILVKTSYFPNWKVSGAQGPYRVTPNLMVVIPTSKHVRLTYGNTPVEYLGWGVTALGLLGLGLVAWRGQVALPAARSRRGEPDPTDPEALGLAGDGVDEPADEAWSEDHEPGWEPPDLPDPDPEPVGFWDSLLAERKAELAQAERGAQDPSGDGGARGSSLLDADGDLRDDEAGPLGS